MTGVKGGGIPKIESLLFKCKRVEINQHMGQIPIQLVGWNIKEYQQDLVQSDFASTYITYFHGKVRMTGQN